MERGDQSKRDEERRVLSQWLGASWEGGEARDRMASGEWRIRRRDAGRLTLTLTVLRPAFSCVKTMMGVSGVESARVGKVGRVMSRMWGAGSNAAMTYQDPVALDLEVRVGSGVGHCELSWKWVSGGGVVS